MFYLRRVTQEGVEINQFVGESYTLVHKDYTPEEFKRLHKEMFLGEDINPDSICFAFVCNGGFVQPLYSLQRNYIMTETGKTFSFIKY